MVLQKTRFYHNQDWQLLTAIMLSARARTKQVDGALPGLFGRFRTAEEVAQASVEEIEEYIRSVGLYKNKSENMKKCCEQLVKIMAGEVPDTLEEVLKLAGVGRKTATLFLADAYGIPGLRWIPMYFGSTGWDGQREKPQQTEQELMKVLPGITGTGLIFSWFYLGREICTARKAKCTQCPASRNGARKICD